MRVAEKSGGARARQWPTINNAPLGEQLEPDNRAWPLPFVVPTSLAVCLPLALTQFDIWPGIDFACPAAAHGLTASQYANMRYNVQLNSKKSQKQKEKKGKPEENDYQSAGSISHTYKCTRSWARNGLTGRQTDGLTKPTTNCPPP